jgi:FkbM family methyltransferase
MKCTPFLKNGNLWENESISYFFSKIPTDKNLIILDIGAHWGLYSLYAKFLPLCTFYSYEPYPFSFNLLNENIKCNNITNVKTFNMAIAEKETDTILNVCESNKGLNTLGSNPIRFNDIEKINVKTNTIDNLFFDKGVDFIKIDTEGYEYFILQGGMNTIKKYKPVIQLEWNPQNMQQAGVNEDMLYTLISQLNYKQTYKNNEEMIIESI